MKRRALILALVVLAAGSTLAWRQLADPHAREVRRIQARVAALANALSFSEKDPPFVRLGYAGKVTQFFDDPISLDVSLGQYVAHETLHRSRLPEGLAGMRLNYRGLEVEFIDIVVDLPPAALAPDNPRPNATVHLTSKIQFVGDRDYWVQEFRLDLQRVEGQWLVRGVTTLKTMER